MFSPEHPTWDENPKIYTPKWDYEHPYPFQMGVIPGNLPGSLLQSSWVPWSSWLLRPGHCTCVILVVKKGALIIAAVFLLCQLCRYVLLNATQAVMNYASCTVVKFLHSVSLCPSHCKTACDRLCPSHCCSQQLTPAPVPMQLKCNPVCQSH